MWTSAINEEVDYTRIILLIIDAGINYAIVEGNIDTGTTSLLSKDHCVNVICHDAHSYHALYCGDLNQMVIKQTGDSSLSGRLGIVTQYFHLTGTKPDGFVVRLGVRDMKFLTRFRGEKCFIEVKHLEHRRFHPSPWRRLPLAHPVVIMNYYSNKGPHHISFSLEKSVVEVINNPLRDGIPPKASFVQPFILSTKKDENGNEIEMKPYDNIDHRQYFRRNDLICFKQVPHRRMERESIFYNCPCHHSVLCPFRHYCGPCSSQPNEEITKRRDIRVQSVSRHWVSVSYPA